MHTPRNLEDMRIDLHAHSTASDGTDTPTQLIENACRAGLDVIAITDHDTTNGWDEAATAATNNKITLVRGIEVSTSTNGINIHMLGYLHNPHHTGLLNALERARNSRENRAQRIVERLANDLPITWNDISSHIDDTTTIGRPHIADALIRARIVPNRDEAFRRYLHDGSPYHVPYESISPSEAIHLIRDAGGVPIIAHPFATKRRGRPVTDDIIEELTDTGLLGIEAHHLDHTPEQATHALDLATQLGLIATGSSDYHGTGKTNRLGDHTTTPQALEAINAHAHGTPILQP
ncbi:DNA polymerase III PolC [Dermatophilus congolensis]|uniref:DNA polymerase III PolC n=1 Tax=Dermatophilus congolensis TaxID=1863 RepID=A0AA46H0J3_9MICO|nr:PHP domain-containing protein [Dermatophilus congolensis]STD10224.1 DNA polymerase III PolC [Dermatophilus congolensis]